MEQIAFISGGTAVYWSSIIFTGAAAVAACSAAAAASRTLITWKPSCLAASIDLPGRIPMMTFSVTVLPNTRRALA